MRNYLTCLTLPRGELRLPVFLPDATHGVVRALDSGDLEACGTQAVVMNTFHLMQRPGTSTVRALGGLHRMAGWPGPIVTDSGGFQAYSLIRENPKYGKLTNRGIAFKPDGAAREYLLTPEKTVQLQVAYGSDVVICLDDCTHPDDPQDAQEESVRRTIAWAARCKETYASLVEEKRMDARDRPLLFAVVQGGRSRELRARCAEALLTIGFDGYGYGGWPLDGEGNLMADMLALTRELIPDQYPLHALGVGHPESVARCAQMGYPMFDSALPTRDARRGRLYAWLPEDEAAGGRSAEVPGWGAGRFAHVYVGDDKHIKSDRPIFEGCGCRTCARYPLGYLHHLHAIEDSAFLRLATIHNLTFMNELMERLRVALTG
jgi:queuine tRNA-ribosyltransferase